MDTTNLIRRIVSELRKQAETYAEDGALVEGEAVLLNRAEAIERMHAEWLGEELNLKEATPEIRYSYSWLQQAVAEGKIPNRGREGAPKVRRGDLMAYFAGDETRCAGSPEHMSAEGEPARHADARDDVQAEAAAAVA